MRKLYEINHDIEALLDAVTDPETGEIVDMDCLEGLFIEREKKLEHVALYCKNIRAEKNAVKAEMDEQALNLYNEVVNALENKGDRDRDETNYLATAYRNGGYILWSTKGDTDAARPYFEKLLKLDPENSLAKKYFEAEAAANAATEEAAPAEQATE